MIRPGDVFSIATAKGEAYFQYVLKNDTMGQAIRVLPGLHPEVQPDMKSLVCQETNFWVFFPVTAALRQRIIKRAGNYELPAHAQQMPFFRSGVVDPQTRRVQNWWLWDGEKSWMVGAITEEQRKLPIKAIWNDTLLIERIESGWLPEHDVR